MWLRSPSRVSEVSHWYLWVWFKIFSRSIKRKYFSGGWWSRLCVVLPSPSISKTNQESKGFFFFLNKLLHLVPSLPLVTLCDSLRGWTCFSNYPKKSGRHCDRIPGRSRRPSSSTVSPSTRLRSQKTHSTMFLWTLLGALRVRFVLEKKMVDHKSLQLSTICTDLPFHW